MGVFNWRWAETRTTENRIGATEPSRSYDTEDHEQPELQQLMKSHNADICWPFSSGIVLAKSTQGSLGCGVVFPDCMLCEFRSI